MDTTLIYIVGSVVIFAQQMYALIGWACPGLVDKT